MTLANQYLHGLGVPQSLREAKKYYRLAAQQGHKEAQLRLDELSQKKT
jgi:TPR repeat protein